MTIPSVVVVGSCMTDLTSYTKVLPRRGETIHGDSFTIGFGGKGANQCVAAARLGASTAMVARVGRDSFGDNYIQNFKNNAVNINHVHGTPNISTGVATIVVDETGENSIIIVGGANLSMTPDDVAKAENLIKGAKVVICQGEIPEEATKQALTLARKHGVTTLFNAAPAFANTDTEIFQLTDILCVNETEAKILTGIEVSQWQNAEDACKHLRLKGGTDGEVILTLGAIGAMYSSSESRDIRIEAPYVSNVIDTTGAGDAFVGALAYFLAMQPELPREDMVVRACEIASISVQFRGTQTSFPYKDTVKDILERSVP